MIHYVIAQVDRERREREREKRGREERERRGEEHLFSSKKFPSWKALMKTLRVSRKSYIRQSEISLQPVNSC